MTSSNDIPLGGILPETNASDVNRQAFAIQQTLAKMQTATLVRVDAVTNSGGLSPVGFVDVTPLVNQMDAQGIPTSHVTIYNIPYFRLQGGANAIILDPQVGDLGICVFASRDISKVKTTRKQANPGSFRKYHWSDGMYLGGVLNGTPSQYVEFSAAGIRIHSPVQVKLDAPDVQIVAPTVEVTASTSVTVTTPIFTVNGLFAQTGGGVAAFSGTITAVGNVTGAGTSLHTHYHSDPQGGNVGPPI